MIRVTIIRQGAEDESEVQEFTRGPISIGRAGQNDIVLANSRVSGTHARVVESESGITLVDNNSTNGTFVNGTLARGPVIVEPNDVVEIGAFTLHFESVADDGDGGELAEVAELPEYVDPEGEVGEISPGDFDELAHEAPEFDEPPSLLGAPEPMLDPGGSGMRRAPEPDVLPGARDFSARSSGIHAAAPDLGPEPLARGAANPAYAPRQTNPDFAAPPADFGPRGHEPAPRVGAEFGDLPRLVAAAPTTGLRGAFDRTATRLSADGPNNPSAEANALQYARSAVDLCCPDLDPRQRRQWAEWIAREVTGLGPLTDLLADEAVSEVFVHGADHIDVRRDGARTRHPTRFSCDRAVELALHRMIGRAPDERHPGIDGVTPAGVVVHAVGKPLVHGGPIVLVTPPQPGPASLADLVGQGRISADAADILASAVARGENVLICGPHGLDTVGWVAAVAAAAPPDQRIVVVHRGAVARTLLGNAIVVDGSRDMHAAVRSALRVRPDCLVVHDLSGREAADLCDAARQTPGALIASLSAVSPEAALARLQTLVSLAVPADAAAVHAFASGSFDLVLGLRAAPSVGAQASSLVEIRHAHGGELVERLDAGE
jgi:pilus assembly protein CpaF